MNSAVESRSLRLMSFNIQAATSTARYHEYLTQSWRQVLPHSQRVANLDAISELVTPFDMVALQEVDAGSLRSGFINQSRYIATHSRLPYWYHQSNRKLATVAHAGNGFLGRFQPQAIEEHRMPGPIPGRGSVILRFGGEDGLVVAVVHLALGQRARGQQLEYLAAQLQGRGRLVVMGDFNTQAESTQVKAFRETLDLDAPTEGLASYPSWQPQRAIDHILVSRSLETRNAAVLEVSCSDHCPVVISVDIPADMGLVEAEAESA